jgi:hypothetical protein
VRLKQAVHARDAAAARSLAQQLAGSAELAALAEAQLTKLFAKQAVTEARRLGGAPVLRCGRCGAPTVVRDGHTGCPRCPIGGSPNG